MVREVAAAQCGIQFDSDALLRANIPESVFSRAGFPVACGMRPRMISPLVIHTDPEHMRRRPRPRSEELETKAGATETASTASSSEGDPATDDALQPLHDELVLLPAWWLLEIVLTDYSWQDGSGLWHRKWG